MELSDFSIIVPIIEVLVLEIFLQFLSHNLSFINPLYFSKVIPQYRCSSIHIEYRYSSLHISWVALDLEILPHPKNQASASWLDLTSPWKVGGLAFINFPCELFLEYLFLLFLWSEELETDSLESNYWLENISGVYVLSLEILLQLWDLLLECLLKLFPLFILCSKFWPWLIFLWMSINIWRIVAFN